MSEDCRESGPDASEWEVSGTDVATVCWVALSECTESVGMVSVSDYEVDGVCYLPW